MIIQYTYEVVETNDTTMTLKYSSPDKPDIYVSMPLPLETETLAGVADMYAPVSNWIKSELKVIKPQIGSGGTSQQKLFTVETIAINQQDAIAQKLIELQGWRREQEQLGVAVQSVKFKFDKDTVSSLLEIAETIKLNPDTKVNWKHNDTEWFEINSTNIEEIISTVLAARQQYFNIEKALQQQIQAGDLQVSFPNEVLT